MKNLYYVLVAFLLSGCNFNNIEITGTAPGMDGGVVSILDLRGQTLFGENIKSGRFTIRKQPIPAYGYFTFSVMSGPFPRDFEIYLQPGKYVIDIPQKEGEYLKITTNSEIQNKLSAYYNFENSIMDKHRQEADKWKAKLNDPSIKDLPEAEFQNITNHIEASRNREHGLHIAAMDMFIKKYPQNDIVPHIITNMDYQTDPYPYYILYKKLSPEAQNTEEGKKVGEELEQLVKDIEAKDKNTSITINQ